MLLIQITAAQGPAECELAVRLTLQALLDDARRAGVQAEQVESLATAAGYKSVLLQLQPPRPGDERALQAWLQGWLGSIQCIFPSPLRPGHRRKNWFVAVQRCPTAGEGPHPALREEDIDYQACRASGKGGQHVNTTDSAVHAVHRPSGIAVKVMSARSQHANKQLARALIALRLAEQAQARQAAARQARTQLHWQVDRGNPVRVLRGP